MGDAILQMTNISKEFPGVKALDNVDFSLRRGEVHAICGENGAGKSTLLKIISGAYATYGGEFLVNGKKVAFNSTRDARNMGISVISQEIQVAPDLTVAENIFMGVYPKNALGIVDWKLMQQKTRKLQERLGSQALSINPNSKVLHLSMGHKQIIEILRAISFEIDILALDEPTSSLSDEETKQLFNLIRDLRSKGISIIYVSHRLQEIFEICDRITVLKDGKLVGTREIEGITISDIVGMMVGRNFELFEKCEKLDLKGREKYLEVQNLSREGAFEDINFSVKSGEILGMFGIVGSGRTEVARVIFGMDYKTNGKILVKGNEVAISSPKKAIANKIGFVTEDRHAEGLILQENIRRNITLPFIKKLAKMRVIQSKMEADISKEFSKALKIKAPSDLTITNNLSGGNQQKVVIAKWLASKADILIFDEPTRGIDVGTKAEIYKLINALAFEGKAIIMISSELPEILGMSDRVLVFKDGRINGEFSERCDLNEITILNKAIVD